jgi:hypothetical protein
LDNDISWKCYIDDIDYTDNDIISWKEQSVNNKMRIKFNGDRTYLSKILTIRCQTIINDEVIIGETQLEITSV